MSRRNITSLSTKYTSLLATWFCVHRHLFNVITIICFTNFSPCRIPIRRTFLHILSIGRHAQEFASTFLFDRLSMMQYILKLHLRPNFEKSVYSMWMSFSQMQQVSSFFSAKTERKNILKTFFNFIHWWQPTRLTSDWGWRGEWSGVTIFDCITFVWHG